MRRRIIIVIVIIGAVAYAPWWFSVLLAVGAIWRFGSGYELLLPAVIADLTYGVPITHFFDFVSTATFGTALVVTLNHVLAKRVFLHP